MNSTVNPDRAQQKISKFFQKILLKIANHVNNQLQKAETRNCWKENLDDMSIKPRFKLRKQYKNRHSFTNHKVDSRALFFYDLVWQPLPVASATLSAAWYLEMRCHKSSAGSQHLTFLPSKSMNSAKFSLQITDSFIENLQPNPGIMIK